MTAAELEPTLRTIVPACRLVPDRVMRRILHELDDLGRPVVVNTRLPWWVSRADLAAVDELDPDLLSGTDDPLLFLVEPDDRSDVAGSDADVRAEYARLLLHAEVFRRAVEGIVSGSLTQSMVAERWAKAGWDYESEARFVFASDHFVPFDAEWATLFPRFVAATWVWLETEPEEMGRYLPSSPPPALARALLHGLLDPTGLPAVPPVRHLAAIPAETTSAADRPGLAARAERVDRTGNHVRAAILWHAAGQPEKAASSVRTGLMGLVAPALTLDPSASARWADAVLPILGPAGQGPWPHAARALYDLQKLGLDLRGELFAVDPVRWARSLGKLSVKLPLARALPVLRYRALASAIRHLEKADLPHTTAGAFQDLLNQALHAAEAEARADYAPRIHAALDAVDLRPANAVERISRDKLTNELVDRACSHGYLRFGDLRDAIARNHVKLPDLRGPGEFVWGDPLLKADRQLADGLAGVYRGGEAYLRGIQRASSLAFGTLPGRLLSKYVALPFGGAFLTLEFTQHMVHAGEGLYKFASKILAPKPLPEVDVPAPPADKSEWVWDDDLEDFIPVQIDRQEAVQVAKQVFTSSDAGPHLVTMPALLGLGLFFLALFYWPFFRALVVRGLKGVGKGLRYLVRDLPLAAWHWEPVRRFRRHPVSRWVNTKLGSGMRVAVLAALVLWFFGASPGRIARGAGLWFALISLLRLLPAGRKIEDRLSEAASDAWRILRVNLIPGLVGWVLGWFRNLAAWVERTLYAVDEWFRFREGQSTPSYRLKVALGCVWFPIAYVVRFAFNLLIEPQINPVKHFPVVTVSHKVLFTALIPLSDATGIPEATLGMIFTGVPGIFGFLAWELRENWRLYAANRPQELKPVRLGHHGETMRGLLRPGFHSGTVPKQYKAIRKQLAKPPAERNEAAIHKAEHELHHIEHAIRVFVQREFLPRLRSAKGWEGVAMTAGSVHLTPTAARVELLAAENGREPVAVTFRLDDGEIRAHIDESGLSAFGVERAETLKAAIKGITALGAAKPDAAFGPAFTWDEWVRFWDRASVPG